MKKSKQIGVSKSLRGFVKVLFWNSVILQLILLIIVLSMCSCKSPQLIPGGDTSHSNDSVRTEYKHDSVYVDRWHTTTTKGDTVFIHDSVYVDRWHKYVKKDSIHITDTIQPPPVLVEKELTKNQVFLMYSGGILWVLIIGIIAAVIIITLVRKR